MQKSRMADDLFYDLLKEMKWKEMKNYVKFTLKNYF